MMIMGGRRMCGRDVHQVRLPPGIGRHNCPCRIQDGLREVFMNPGKIHL